jgi:hypothetical protein
MRCSSYLSLAIAALMHAGSTAALPRAEIICPAPPAVLRALQPEICPGKVCTTAANCCTCYACEGGVSALSRIPLTGGSLGHFQVCTL